MVFSRYFIFYTSQHAKFTFHCNIELMSIVNNLLC